MQSKCPHCDKAIRPGAIICPHCGSYVVQMEEKKRRWHMVAIPVAMILAVAGILLYIEVKEQEIEARRQAILEAERPVDPAVQRQHEQDEADRRRKAARRNQIEAEKAQRLALRKANEAWRAKPNAEKATYLTGELKGLRDRIKSLKASAQGEATEDFRVWLTRFESKLAAADTFIDAEQYDQARGLIEGAVEELDALLGTGDSGKEEAPPAAESVAAEGLPQDPAPAAN